MALSTAGNRILYAGEALAILLVMPFALYPSTLTLIALVSLPALVLAVVGVFRPYYFARLEFTDPRGGRRRYMHVCAGLCAAFIAWILGCLAFS